MMVKIIMPCGRKVRRGTTKYAPFVTVPHSDWYHGKRPIVLKGHGHPDCPCDKAQSFDGIVMCEGEYDDLRQNA